MKNIIFLKQYFILFFSLLLISVCSGSYADTKIDQALEAKHRTPSYVERDQYRHPKETLLFFGLTQEQSVIEITPGYGWYAEILAPLLKPKGYYCYASYTLHKNINPYFVKMEKSFSEKMKKNPEVYSDLNWVHFNPKTPNFPPEGPVDMVLTFRNVHNWAKAGSAESMFDGFAKALKPGGVLGVVEHRAKPGTPLKTQIKSGYMTVDYVVGLAKKSGFRLDASSEINANPKDDTNHPGGVWNLPPNMRGISDKNRDSIKAIGESDRMTLRFVKK